jgi:hypothetical protein
MKLATRRGSAGSRVARLDVDRLIDVGAADDGSLDDRLAAVRTQTIKDTR